MKEIIESQIEMKHEPELFQSVSKEILKEDPEESEEILKKNECNKESV